MKTIIVIGGGASGLMAACHAAQNGNEVILIEKNEKLGKKIYITGKGRCNLTNDCPPDLFLENVVHGKQFLRGAIARFSPQDTMEFFEQNGLSLVTERGRRVFPASFHASDVTKTLEKCCSQAGVCIHLNEKVNKIGVANGQVQGLVTDKAVYSCHGVIVATGGLSYPATGSTGDGYAFAKELGHTVTPCAPSLVGLNLKGDFSKAQGVSLKNVALSASANGKVIFSEMGELLFTHFGVSGPLVLSLSALINKIPVKTLRVSLDFKPALDYNKLNTRLLRDFEERKNEQMKNVIRGLLPKGVGSMVLEKSKISPLRQANAVTKEERERLCGVLKDFPLEITSLRGFSEAVITSGGVSTKEVNPVTMESKKIKGLYFCGEVLDVDALTGGFNLQIAFSTGYAAGSNAGMS